MRDLSGTGQVYRFTLSQLLKSNANRITLLLMVLLAAVSMPLTALMCGETPEVSDTSSLTAVRLENRTALDLDFSGDSYWADTVFSAGAEDPDAVVTVSGDVTGYQVAVSGADDVDQSELRLLADAVQTAIRDACVRAAGLTAQQLAQLEGSPLPEENFDGSRFWVQYGYSILAMMVCLMSASYVIRAVVEEKDSRLVELLLVSVKPMALLAGKILAVMAFTFGWLLAMLAGFGVSCGLTAALMGSDVLHRQLSGVLAALPQAAPDVWHLVSLLAVLLGGVRVYRGLAERGRESFQRRTAMEFLETRLRQADSAGGVWLGAFDGTESREGDTLFLRETLEGEEYLTRVYCWDGQLRELFTPV